MNIHHFDNIIILRERIRLIKVSVVIKIHHFDKILVHICFQSLSQKQIFHCCQAQPQLQPKLSWELRWLYYQHAPSTHPATHPPATHPISINLSNFKAQYELDLKGKVVSLNDQTLEIFSDLNPIDLGVNLTLFQPASNLGKYFEGLGIPLPQRQSFQSQWLDPKNVLRP